MNAKHFYRNWRRWLVEAALLGLAGAGLYALSLLPTPGGGPPVGTFYWTWDNASFMAAQGIAIALGALGMALILLSGGIDLSAGAGAVLSGLVAAVLLQRGASAGSALGAALLVGGAVGAVNGLLAGTLRIAPFAVTLGTFGAAHGLARWIAGDEPVVVSAESGLAGMLRGLTLAPVMGGVLLLTVVLALLLRSTVFGRHLRAIGSNEEAATLCGVRVRLTKALTYTVAGFLFGAAGLAATAVAGQGTAHGGVGLEIAFLAAATIGGVKLGGGAGGVFGALAGALVFTALLNGIQQAGWPVPLQEVGMGGLLVAAVGLSRWRGGRSM